MRTMRFLCNLRGGIRHEPHKPIKDLSFLWLIGRPVKQYTEKSSISGALKIHDDPFVDVASDTNMPDTIAMLGGLDVLEHRLRATILKILSNNGLKDWRFSFDRALSRAGQCDYRNKMLSISKFYVTSKSVTYKDVSNTVFHEIAHALAPHHNHDAVWKAMAIKLGGDGERLCKPFRETRFVGTCGCPLLNHYRNRLVARRMPKCQKCSYEIKFVDMGNK